MLTLPTKSVVREWAAIHSKTMTNDIETQTTPDLRALSDDLLVHILGYLHWKELNALALVSKQLQKARADPTLDQTVELVIRLADYKKINPGEHSRQLEHGKRQMSMEEMVDLIKQWKARMRTRIPNNGQFHVVYRGFNRLRIITGSDGPDDNSWYNRYVDHRRGANETIDHTFPFMFPTLDQVKSIEFIQSRDDFTLMSREVYLFLTTLHPRLREIDISRVGALENSVYAPVPRILCDSVCSIRMDNLSCRQDWNFLSNGCPPMQGMLKALYLDNAIFYVARRNANLADNSMFLFHHRSKLEAVSCKRARLCADNLTSIPYAKELSQEQLLDFVRHAHKLRWFKSDLSPQNIALLRVERPDVLFVS